MRQNDYLKLHFVNVNHGDATIIEFPDYGAPKTAHFGVIDFGAQRYEDRTIITQYMKKLINFRKDGDISFNYRIEFACVTHPHLDHYGGLGEFIATFSDKNNANNNKINAFWDCGFRTTEADYNEILVQISENDHITFVRTASGSEYEFGDTRIVILAPSIDLRNRFDTHGIKKNDSSVVMMIQYGKSCIILGGDAQFASWGKSTEEFPTLTRIKFVQDSLGLAEKKETTEPLNCNLLRISHHGSKHGSSLEQLERLDPEHIVIPAGSADWYKQKQKNWKGKFPHPLVKKILDTLKIPKKNIHITGDEGNIIVRYSGANRISKLRSFDVNPADSGFDATLQNCWQ